MYKFDKKRSSVLTDILEEHNEDHGHEKHILHRSGSIDNVRNFNGSSTNQSITDMVIVEMQDQKHLATTDKDTTNWIDNPLQSKNYA